MADQTRGNLVRVPRGERPTRHETGVNLALRLLPPSRGRVTGPGCGFQDLCMHWKDASACGGIYQGFSARFWLLSLEIIVALGGGYE